MAYTVNADDQSRPLDTDPRKQGAEELRALKARLIQTRTTLENADSSNAAAAAAALAAANAAQSSANNAQSSANAAQSAANSAASAASTAQGTADAALALLGSAACAGYLGHIVLNSEYVGNLTVPTSDKAFIRYAAALVNPQLYIPISYAPSDSVLGLDDGTYFAVGVVPQGSNQSVRVKGEQSNLHRQDVRTMFAGNVFGTQAVDNWTHAAVTSRFITKSGSLLVLFFRAPDL